jgi:hypothetical protein
VDCSRLVSRESDSAALAPLQQPGRLAGHDFARPRPQHPSLPVRACNGPWGPAGRPEGSVPTGRRRERGPVHGQHGDLRRSAHTVARPHRGPGPSPEDTPREPAHGVGAAVTSCWRVAGSSLRLPESAKAQPPGRVILPANGPTGDEGRARASAEMERPSHPSTQCFTASGCDDKILTRVYDKRPYIRTISADVDVVGTYRPVGFCIESNTNPF